LANWRPGTVKAGSDGHDIIAQDNDAVVPSAYTAVNDVWAARLSLECEEGDPDLPEKRARGHHLFHDRAAAGRPDVLGTRPGPLAFR
jgi:hypothetical protein